MSTSPVVGAKELPPPPAAGPSSGGVRRPRNVGEFDEAEGVYRLAGWSYKPRVCGRCVSKAARGWDIICVPPKVKKGAKKCPCCTAKNATCENCTWEWVEAELRVRRVADVACRFPGPEWIEQSLPEEEKPDFDLKAFTVVSNEAKQLWVEEPETDVAKSGKKRAPSSTPGPATAKKVMVAGPQPGPSGGTSALPPLPEGPSVGGFPFLPSGGDFTRPTSHDVANARQYRDVIGAALSAHRGRTLTARAAFRRMVLEVLQIYGRNLVLLLGCTWLNRIAYAVDAHVLQRDVTLALAMALDIALHLKDVRHEQLGRAGLRCSQARGNGEVAVAIACFSRFGPWATDGFRRFTDKWGGTSTAEVSVRTQYSFTVRSGDTSILIIGTQRDSGFSSVRASTPEDAPYAALQEFSSHNVNTIRLAKFAQSQQVPLLQAMSRETVRVTRPDLYTLPRFTYENRPLPTVRINTQRVYPDKLSLRVSRLEEQSKMLDRRMTFSSQYFPPPNPRSHPRPHLFCEETQARRGGLSPRRRCIPIAVDLSFRSEQTQARRGLVSTRRPCAGGPMNSHPRACLPN